MMETQEMQNKEMLKQTYKKKGITATILGIISLISCLGPISFVCGIIAIVVGAKTRKKSQKTTGTAGMVMGIIGVVLSVILLLVGSITAGIMAPSLLAQREAYEGMNEDVQLCETIQEAITWTMLDPRVLVNEDGSLDRFYDGKYHRVSDLYNSETVLGESFVEFMEGYGYYSYNHIEDSINAESLNGFYYDLQFCVDESENVTVILMDANIVVE